MKCVYIDEVLACFWIYILHFTIGHNGVVLTETDKCFVGRTRNVNVNLTSQIHELEWRTENCCSKWTSLKVWQTLPLVFFWVWWEPWPMGIKVPWLLVKCFGQHSPHRLKSSRYLENLGQGPFELFWRLVIDLSNIPGWVLLRFVFVLNLSPIYHPSELQIGPPDNFTWTILWEVKDKDDSPWPLE